jgi:hypothetical protein
MSRGLDSDPIHDLEAARFRLPETAAFSGVTAAWLHGIDVSPYPIEATVADDAGISARAGLILRRAILPECDVVRARSMRTTAIARTIADISLRLIVSEAVVITDAALHAGLIDIERLDAWARSHARRRGIRRLRRVIELAEPAAESPMETRLRLLLVMAGLPWPLAQVSICDRFGEFAGRPDLYYEPERLGIEYDGDVHRSALAADNRRQNKLQSAGVRLLRFTASDVLGNPASVITQVRAELHIDRRRMAAI